MKRLTVMLVVLLSVGMLWATPPNYYQYNPNYRHQNDAHLQGGEHTPTIYSGSGMCSNTSTITYTGGWMQQGYSPDAERGNNKDISYFGSKVFTVGIKLDADGSDCGLTSMYFEYMYDTTETDMATLRLTAGDSSFTIGELVTGSISGATGTIKAIVADLAGGLEDSALTVHSVTGTFDAGSPDFIIGATSGASDILAGVTAFDRSGWNADSSNFVVEDQYTHSQYGTWRFEALTDTSRWYWHTFRGLVGAYHRIVCDSDSAGETTVNWVYVSEN